MLQNYLRDLLKFSWEMLDLVRLFDVKGLFDVIGCLSGDVGLYFISIMIIVVVFSWSLFWSPLLCFALL